MPLTSKTVQNFQGVFTSYQKLAQPKGAISLDSNLWFSTRGSLRTIPGSLILSAPGSGAPSVVWRAIQYFFPSFASSYRLFALSVSGASAALYDVTGATWNSPALLTIAAAGSYAKRPAILGGNPQPTPGLVPFADSIIVTITDSVPPYILDQTTPPGPPVLSSVASGALPGATYYVRLVYHGYASASVESNIVIAANHVFQVASPAPPPAPLVATSYDVYASTTPGTEELQTANLPIPIGTPFTLPNTGLVTGVQLAPDSPGGHQLFNTFNANAKYAKWKPNHHYKQGVIVAIIVNNIQFEYESTESGRTGAGDNTPGNPNGADNANVFPTQVNATIVDGSLGWKCLGPVPGPPPGAAYAFSHLGFLWLWGVSSTYLSDGITGPDALWQSALNDPESYDPAFAGFVGKGDGQTAQGGAVLTLEESGIAATQQLVLFKDASTYSVFGDFSTSIQILQAPGGVGCVAPHTVQYMANLGILRLSYKGITLFDGQNDNTELYTDPIRGYIFGLNDPTTDEEIISPLDWDNIQDAQSTQVKDPSCYVMIAPIKPGAGGAGAPSPGTGVGSGLAFGAIWPDVATLNFTSSVDAINWTAQTNNLIPNNGSGFEFVTDGAGVVLAFGSSSAGGEFGNFCRSTDGGATWSAASALGYEVANSFQKSAVWTGSKFVVIGTQSVMGFDQGFALVSSDRGQTWTAFRINPDNTQHHACTSLEWSPDLKLLITGDDHGIIYRSSDGQNWEICQNSLGWTPQTIYQGGQVLSIVASDGLPYLFNTSGGVSGTSEPIFPTVLGSVVLDNHMTWTNLGPGTVPDNSLEWEPNTSYPGVGAQIIAIGTDFHPYIFEPNGGISGGAQPAWPPALGATVMDNGMTWTNVGSAVWGADGGYVWNGSYFLGFYQATVPPGNTPNAQYPVGSSPGYGMVKSTDGKIWTLFPNTIATFLNNLPPLQWYQEKGLWVMDVDTGLETQFKPGPYWSADGVSWTRGLGLDVLGAPPNHDIQGALRPPFLGPNGLYYYFDQQRGSFSSDPLYTTPDLKNYTLLQLNPTYGYLSACPGPKGTLVAIGQTGNVPPFTDIDNFILTSPDGLVWTVRVTDENANIQILRSIDPPVGVQTTRVFIYDLQEQIWAIGDLPWSIGTAAFIPVLSDMESLVGLLNDGTIRRIMNPEDLTWDGVEITGTVRLPEFGRSSQPIYLRRFNIRGEGSGSITAVTERSKNLQGTYVAKTRIPPQQLTGPVDIQDKILSMHIDLAFAGQIEIEGIEYQIVEKKPTRTGR